MSLPAFQNEFVGKFLNKDLPATFTYSSGRVSHGVRTHNIGYAGRTFKSKNKVRLIAGILPWRDPSDYRRMVTKSTIEPADAYKNGTHYTDFSVGDNNTEKNIEPYIGKTGEYVRDLGFVPHIANLRNRATTECLLKLSESKVNLGQFMAESRESANTIASAGTNILELLNDVRRKRFSRVIRRLKDPRTLSNGLLQWRYGWRPLCADLYNMHLEHQNSIRRPLLVKAVRNLHESYPLKRYNGGYDMTGDVRIDYTCSITAMVKDGTVASANQYGLINPASLAWELIPYSFVVDWLMPLGNYFAALTATAGLTFVGGYRGQRCQGNIYAKYTPSGYTGVGCSVNREFFCYDRARLGGFPAPAPYIKSPFSTEHVENFIALLISSR